MTEVKLIFRFEVSEVVYPPIEELIKSEKPFNIISGDKIRNVFLKSESPVAEKINYFMDKGEIIPTEYWCPFWTSMIMKDTLNIFTSMVGNAERFKEFEKCMESQKIKITDILYLKVNDISKLTQLAKMKYPKVYDNSEVIKKNIEEYDLRKTEIINYATSKYPVSIIDFFINEIII